MSYSDSESGYTAPSEVGHVPCSSVIKAVDESDIGKLLESSIDLHSLSREAKHRIFATEPNPDPTCYPHSRPHASGAFLQFQPTWMKQYPWLHYSKHVDGAFCHACAFFPPEKVGGITPGQFVTKPFKSWVKRCDKMEAHARLAYHMAAMTKMDEFVVRFEHPSETIDT